MSPLPSSPRAGVIGTGLMGGSLAAALQTQGWYVTGWDGDEQRRQTALRMGLLDEVGIDPDAHITFIAVPVGAVPAAAAEALVRGGVVTDIGSVKAPIVDAVDHPMFVGGHPMAGSEAVGVQGASAGLFQGAVWVLTPTATTDPDAQALVHSVVRSLGAEVLTISAPEHDRLVAAVSHVPHLVAASLMRMAADRAVEHSAILRLAAGGFRDMTRIASGDPRMWLDICADNRDAILEVLDEVGDKIAEMREVVASGDSAGLKDRLTSAQEARRSLPIGVPEVDRLAEVSVPIPDRPGELAAVTALATSLSVNVYDIDVVHSAEERGGRLRLIIDLERVEDLVEALRSSGRTVMVSDA